MSSERISERVEWRADEKYNKQIMAILDTIINASAKRDFMTWHRALDVLSMHIIGYIEKYENETKVDKSVDDMLQSTRVKLKSIMSARNNKLPYSTNELEIELKEMYKQMIRILQYFNVFAGMSVKVDEKASEVMI